MPPSYSSRRGQAVNVSQLLQDLNRVPEPPAQVSEENLRNLDDELAMFTNTNFIDWDASDSQQHQRQPQQAASVNLDTQTATSPTDDGTIGGDLSGFDFNLSGDFNGFDFHPYSAPNVPGFSDNLGNLQPIQPSPAFPSSSSPQSAYPPVPQTGDKRKSTDAAISAPPRRQLSFEEQSRFAAEEDKRRRNTAASARFRIKKKAREQALEKREKELSDKVGSLEGRIQTLETENKWLRELVMEKNGGNDTAISSLLEKRTEKKTPSKESEGNGKGEAEKAS
ncbi:hypothetical protein F4818DRAFT_15805 [Hypoxylon cercidicola]|nr:hypothetical protein F4818DRAFT_15805 [Hypoxylon cercidicola]